MFVSRLYLRIYWMWKPLASHLEPRRCISSVFQCCLSVLCIPDSGDYGWNVFKIFYNNWLLNVVKSDFLIFLWVTMNTEGLFLKPTVQMIILIISWKISALLCVCCVQFMKCNSDGHYQLFIDSWWSGSAHKCIQFLRKRHLKFYIVVFLIYYINTIRFNKMNN